MNEIHSLQVTRYTFEYIDGNPKIVIHQVKALDRNGKYIRFVKLVDVMSMLADYPITYKPL